MNESIERKTGAVLSYISIIINTLIQLLYTQLLIKKLGQSEFGLYSLVSSIIGYLTVLDLGFGNSIIVYTSRYRAQNKKEEEKKLHGMFKIIFIIIGIIAAILGLILFIFVDNIFGKTMSNTELGKMKIMMLILSFNLLITFSFSIYNSIISAYEKFTYQKIVSIISSILKPLIMIPFLYLGFKSITMCIVITIVNVLVLLSNYLYCKNKLKINTKFLGFDKAIFKTILGYSIWIFLGVIVDKINWSVDQFVLGSVSGTIAVSVYSIASTLNTLFINLSTAISGVLLPKMSKMIATKTSSKALTSEMIKVGRIQYYIIFLMVSGLVIFGKQFIEIWLGKGFEESYYVSLILIIPVCFPLIQNLGISIMQAMNKYKFKSISTFIMAIINVIISIFLAKKYGAIGAALGTAIGLVICNIILINVYYYKEIKINVFKFWKEILKMTIVFLVPVLIIEILINIININGLLFLIIYIPIYVFIYCIISYFLVMNNYEKNIIKKIKQRRK